MQNAINGAAGLASPQAPSLRLNCLSPPNGWRSGENKDESGYKSFFWKAEDETGCLWISCKMDKKEGGESQLDVGGKNGHRLSPIDYTSIAEIKGFRFTLRKDHFHQEEITKRE